MAVIKSAKSCTLKIPVMIVLLLIIEY